MIKRYLGVAVMCVSLPVLAEEPASSGWVGDVAFGYSRKSGNTRSSALDIDISAVLEQEQWKHSLGIDYDFESENDSTTEDDTYLTWQSDYKLSDVDYLYGFGSFKDDRFSGVDEEFVLSAGYGRILIDDDVYYLEVDAGPGLRKTNPTDGDTRDDVIARIAERFTWQLSDTAAVKQELTVETGGGNTTSKFTIALETMVVENIALRVGYEVDHKHKVPDDRHRTDTKTTVSLVYKFK